MKEQKGEKKKVGVEEKGVGGAENSFETNPLDNLTHFSAGNKSYVMYHRDQHKRSFSLRKRRQVAGCCSHTAHFFCSK